MGAVSDSVMSWTVTNGADSVAGGAQNIGKKVKDKDKDKDKEKEKEKRTGFRGLRGIM